MRVSLCTAVQKQEIIILRLLCRMPSHPDSCKTWMDLKTAKMEKIQDRENCERQIWKLTEMPSVLKYCRLMAIPEEQNQ